MTPNYPLRKLAIITGLSYLVIFFTAIFANFGVLEALKQHPLRTVQQDPLWIGAGIVAFLITVVFDVVIAWALQALFQKHWLSGLSTLLRMMHAAIMGVAIFALPLVRQATTAQQILHQVEIFNTIWLIGLFFFGLHLILLGQILKGPLWIALLLKLAGLMYMLDTVAHFVLPDYNAYATLFLTLVALPSMVGEMSLALWLLRKGGKHSPATALAI